MHSHNYLKPKEGDIYKFCKKIGCKKRKKIVVKAKNKTLRNACDKDWARITKLIHTKRFGPICGWCKKPSSELQSDHIINRWKMATRWNVHNCIVLDKVCHLYRKKREPFSWAESVREYVGEDVLEELKRVSQEIIKPDYMTISKYLKDVEAGIERMEFVNNKNEFVHLT